MIDYDELQRVIEDAEITHEIVLDTEITLMISLFVLATVLTLVNVYVSLKLYKTSENLEKHV